MTDTTSRGGRLEDQLMTRQNQLGSGLRAACVLLLAGCAPDAPPQSTTSPPQSTGTPAVAASDMATEETVFQGSLADCAGFTAADAARILGVPPERIVQPPDVNATDTLQLCNYPDPEDWRVGFSFYLSREDSVERARATMAMGHGLAGMAQQRIAQMIDSQPMDAPLILVPDLGDEVAYRMAVNNALSVRVKNIIVQVLGGELEQQRQVAELVVKGLRED